jgi:hypothetical protein
MANRKNLKKDINYLTYELIAECLTYQSFHKDLNSNTVDEVATTILENRNNLISRINHVNGKDNRKLVKEHFSSIRKDFEKSIEAMDILEKQK